MYEAKYDIHLIRSQSRFAEDSEIMNAAAPIHLDQKVRAAGIPLMYKDNTMFCDNSENHTLIVGPTGCGKTRSMVFPTLETIIAHSESAIVSDSKGEIYARTAAKARSRGIRTYVLNFRHPEASDFWNPLSLPQRCFKEGKQTETIQLVNDFVESICSPLSHNTADRYWVDTSKALLISLILLLIASVPKAYVNLKNLTPLCYEKNSEQLKTLLCRMDDTSACAFGLHAVLDLQADRTKSCIYGTVQSVLSPFIQNSGLLDMLSDSSFDFDEIGKKPTIVYIIYPDEKECLNFLINSVIIQGYQALLSYADLCPGKRLPVRVNLLLDEFSNLPLLNGFSNMISESRSRGIRFILIVQSYFQLKNKYDTDADTILSNCANWVCFSTKETDFIAKLSAICGREVDANGIEHDLLSSHDMQYLRKGFVDRDGYVVSEALLLKQGLHPYVMQLRDIDSIPELRDYELSDPAASTHRSHAKFIGAKELITGIKKEKYPFPFPKKNEDIEPSEPSESCDELGMRFAALFGDPDESDDD